MPEHREPRLRTKVTVIVVSLFVAAAGIGFMLRAFGVFDASTPSGPPSSSAAWHSYASGWGSGAFQIKIPSDWHVSSNIGQRDRSIGVSASSTDPVPVFVTPKEATLLPPTSVVVSLRTVPLLIGNSQFTNASFPLSLADAHRYTMNGFTGYTYYFEYGLHLFELQAWVGTHASPTDRSLLAQAVASIRVTPSVQSPPPTRQPSPLATQQGPTHTSEQYSLSLSSPPKWAVSWSHLAAMPGPRPVAAIASAPFTSKSCPVVPAGQVAVFLSEEAPDASASSQPGYHFPPPGYAPLPAAFSLPAPGKMNFTEGCVEQRDDLVRWSEGARYFYAHALFGAGAYATKATEVESLLSSIKVLGPWAPAQCSHQQVRAQLSVSRDRGFEILGFNFLNSGSPCRLLSQATLKVFAPGLRTFPGLPNNTVSVAPVLQSGSTGMGSWSIWNWCGARPRIFFQLVTAYGVDTRNQSPIAACVDPTRLPSVGWRASHLP
jgi:hypothetical protein